MPKGSLSELPNMPVGMKKVRKTKQSFWWLHREKEKFVESFKEKERIEL